MKKQNSNRVEDTSYFELYDVLDALLGTSGRSGSVLLKTINITALKVLGYVGFTPRGKYEPTKSFRDILMSNMNSLEALCDIVYDELKVYKHKVCNS